jgi:hypothetical protein
MSDTRLTLEIDGSPVVADDLAQVLEVQAEEASDEADAATVSVALSADAQGEWTSLLDPLATPRTPLVIELARGSASYRFEGSSTEAEWQVAPDGVSRLTVKAVDRTLDMNVEEKVVAWPGTTDSGIAQGIFGDYGFTPDVEVTPDSADPDVHVVVQRATDWAFLRSLADKWGYAAYLESTAAGIVGSFRPLDPLAEPQAQLSLGFGGDAADVSVRARLLGGREVKGDWQPPLGDQVLSGDDTGQDQAQGATPLGGQTTVLLSPVEVDGELDPQETARGLARRASFAVELSARFDADRIDTVLRARRTVLVGGLGTLLSGTYLVQRVRHRVTRDGHVQHVTLVRNALGAS